MHLSTPYYRRKTQIKKKKLSTAFCTFPLARRIYNMLARYDVERIEEDNFKNEDFNL